MLKHIVMWELKDYAEDNSKTENAMIMKGMLEALRDMIPEIEKIEVGININPSKSAYDVVLYSEFRDKARFTLYLNHPDHLDVAEFVGKISKNRIVVDYMV